MATVKEIAPHALQPEHLRVAAYCRVSSDSEDQLHYPTEMMSGGTLAIGQCVSTFYLSQFFTSSGINFCPGSRISFPTTLSHCVDAGYAQNKKQEKTNMTMDSTQARTKMFEMAKWLEESQNLLDWIEQAPKEKQAWMEPTN